MRRRGDRDGDGGGRVRRVERVVQWVVLDRGRGGLAIRAREEEKVEEVIVAVGAYEDVRRPTQRRRSDV